MQATKPTGDRPVNVHEGAPERRPDDSLRVVAPAVDIYEDKDRLVLIADLPGVQTNDIHLDVNKDVLTITAKWTGQGCFTGETVYSELTPVQYYRAFALGDDLDATRISASMRNGVLELVVPKAEKAMTRKIKVEQG
jgi:HSP20 family protein